MQNCRSYTKLVALGLCYKIFLYRQKVILTKITFHKYLNHLIRTLKQTNLHYLY